MWAGHLLTDLLCALLSVLRDENKQRSVAQSAAALFFFFDRKCALSGSIVTFTRPAALALGIS